MRASWEAQRSSVSSQGWGVAPVDKGRFSLSLKAIISLWFQRRLSLCDFKGDYLSLSSKAIISLWVQRRLYIVEYEIVSSLPLLFRKVLLSSGIKLAFGFMHSACVTTFCNDRCPTSEIRGSHFASSEDKALMNFPMFDEWQIGEKWASTYCRIVADE